MSDPALFGIKICKFYAILHFIMVKFVTGYIYALSEKRFPFMLIMKSSNLPGF